VIVYLIVSVLLGTILGRFCNVRALFLASTFVLIIFIVRFAYGEHSLLRSLFEFAMLNTSLQISYVIGLFYYERLPPRDRNGRRFTPSHKASLNHKAFNS
jgi:hypothetical protein